MNVICGNFVLLFLLVLNKLSLSFIVSFSFYAPNPENDGKKVQEFFTTMETTIRDHPLWADATDEEVDSAMEVNADMFCSFWFTFGRDKFQVCTLNGTFF